MKIDYKVQLPDHDWVVGSRHKLIPSVYAGLEILENGLSYSCPTYIAIRSGKHDSSTALGHAEDLAHLVETIDGGPDESPRNQNTLKYAAVNFRRWNLDACFVATHVPHQSASNPVEKRIAPLSRDLCGLILPHETFGCHLNKSGKTTNVELEKQNFQKAGEILAEVWSQRVIDKFPVVAEYVLPNVGKQRVTSKSIVDQTAAETEISTIENEQLISTKKRSPVHIPEDMCELLTEAWKMKYVRQSQYLLQIVKCEDLNCCRPIRTNIREFLNDQFLPAPIPLLRTELGLKIRNPYMKNEPTTLIYQQKGFDC